VAPAFSVNFSNWKTILAWFKTQGVSVIVNVSLGIEICTWAHLRYLEQYKREALITQPCPPIVSYIEKYHRELLDRLSPVISPILCTAVCLKKVLKQSEKIAALTPCPAKADEFSKSDSVNYNVTFKKLADYLIAHNISVPPADFCFDHITVAARKALKIPSSLTESVRRVIGCINFGDSKIKIDTKKYQNNVYRYLDLISGEEREDHPVLFDALNCIGGCDFGSGCNKDKPEPMADKHHEVEAGRNIDQANLFSVFDYTLKLSDYIKQNDCNCKEQNRS
jgi:iron only hydrogenase large subunit-like protein